MRGPGVFSLPLSLLSLCLSPFRPPAGAMLRSLHGWRDGRARSELNGTRIIEQHYQPLPTHRSGRTLQVCARGRVHACTTCVRAEAPLTRRSNKSTCLSTASSPPLLLPIPPSLLPPPFFYPPIFCSQFLSLFLHLSLSPLCSVILLLKLRGWCCRHYVPPDKSLSASRAEQRGHLQINLLLCVYYPSDCTLFFFPACMCAP